MKTLVHRTPISDGAAVALSEVKAHMRVTHDFEDDAIDLMVSAAAAEVERLCQVALLTQLVTVTIFAPDLCAGLRLPIGPALGAPSVSLDGAVFIDFQFVGGIRPYLRWGSTFFDLTPELLVITYQAGFGETAEDLPADIRQAVADQATCAFDGRGAADERERTTSPHMARIAARYRGVQA